jgi:hypothetical protein
VADRIVAFAGSLRRGSLNRALIHAAQELAPDGMTIEPIEIGALPFHNADVEAEGDPPSVAAFKATLRQADGILIATPEYNDGIPKIGELSGGLAEVRARSTGDTRSPATTATRTSAPCHQGATSCRRELIGPVRAGRGATACRDHRDGLPW